MPKDLDIALPRGFLFAAASAGLRKHGAGPDVALIYSQAPARAAALFTTNRVKAAPVLLSRKHLESSGSIARAIVVNAGNANCATGPHGITTARECARCTATLLKVPRNQVLLASTGVIGVPLDASTITSVLPKMARRLHPEGAASVASAILTTDTRPKMLSRRSLVSGRPINILGVCKGAGMIHPRMATMLAFFVTDAAVAPSFLQEAARAAADSSFNRISVDGDTSTNDTLYLLANGMAGNRKINNKSDAKAFMSALIEVAQSLAVMMVRDGEGAKKLAEITVEGARNAPQAEAIARAIANSPLVKTAIAGADPNWGRILSAAGSAGAELNPERVAIHLNGTLVCKNGAAADYNERAVQKSMRAGDVAIRVALGMGRARSRFWTCDFTEQYIRINASYRT